MIETKSCAESNDIRTVQVQSITYWNGCVDRFVESHCSILTNESDSYVLLKAHVVDSEKIVRGSIHPIPLISVLNSCLNFVFQSGEGRVEVRLTVPKLIEKLSDERSRLTSGDAYPLLAQLISNEINVLKDCRDSGCLAQAGKIYAGLVERGTSFIAPEKTSPVYGVA